MQKNAKERFLRIGRIITQLEDLQKLIEDNRVDKAELYNAASVKKLFKLMPEEVVNETLEEIKDNMTQEEKIKTLKTVLEILPSGK